LYLNYTSRVTDLIEMCIDWYFMYWSVLFAKVTSYYVFIDGALCVLMGIVVFLMC